MHENSDNAHELEPHMVKTLDTLQKKKDLLEMWSGIESVCQAILAGAKENPLAVKASLLHEVVQSLKALREVISMAEELDKELKEADEREESPDGLTDEERRALEEYHRIAPDMRQYDFSIDDKAGDQ